MGQKANPIGLRVGINRTWSSLWYSEKDYGKLLHQDFKIRNYISEKFSNASVSSVLIERSNKRLKIAINTSRPGAIIGKGGESIDKIKKFVNSLNGNSDVEVSIDLVEVKKPELDAKIIAMGIAEQLEKRVPFKKAMKRALSQAMKLGAGGIKIKVSGRLGGAEIARSEWEVEGNMPLHTLRAHIDYAIAEACTTYGVIGVKVWVYNK